MTTSRHQAGGRRRGWALLWLAGLALWGLAPRAEAQWGFGPFGFGGLNQTPASVDLLNQRAQINAQNAATNRGPRSNNVYAGNPNSYLNNVRDSNANFSLVPRFDVTSRLPMETRPLPRPAPRPETSPGAAPPSRARSAPAIVTFFDAMRRLVWPADAPVSGDLGPKRATADQAILAVRDQYDQQGQALVSSAAHARNQLVDYGQPALKAVRAATTTQVADNFHSFLLSLYESIGQAATVGKPSQP